jgi:transposase-like protein
MRFIELQLVEAAYDSKIASMKKKHESEFPITEAKVTTTMLKQMIDMYVRGEKLDIIAKAVNVLHRSTVIRQLRNVPNFEQLKKQRQDTLFKNNISGPGKRRGINQDRKQQMADLYSQGYTPTQIANAFGVTYELFKRYLRQFPNFEELKTKHIQNMPSKKLKSVPAINENEDKNGDCFEIAAKNVLYNKLPGMKLVHAYVSGQGSLKGRRFEHAWNEIGDVVFDYSNGRKIVMRKEDYYKLGNIVKTPGQYMIYDKPEAVKKMVTTKHYGPWDLD